MPGSEMDVSDLYGLPLAEFTKARNELAKQASARGDSEQVEQIKRLQKPTLPAWVLNMLPRLRESELAELLRAGELAEAAQAGVLAGSGDGDQLREASDQLRRAARRLAAEAGEILVKDGHAAREQTLQRVARALETSAVTAGGRERLEKGEFAEEPEAAGFDLFADLSTPPAGKRPKTAAAAQRAAARQAVEEARADLQQCRAERGEAEAATREAERAAQARQREAEEAWRLVEHSRQRAQRAEAAELEARQRLDAAREQLRKGAR
jgi:hypothetical protein